MRSTTYIRFPSYPLKVSPKRFDTSCRVWASNTYMAYRPLLPKVFPHKNIIKMPIRLIHIQQISVVMLNILNSSIVASSPKISDTSFFSTFFIIPCKSIINYIHFLFVVSTDIRVIGMGNSYFKLCYCFQPTRNYKSSFI